MAQRFYRAVLEQTSDGFNVFVPDFPGCTSWGATADDAARNAEEALALYVEAGPEQPLPESSALDAPLDPEAEPAAIVLVPLEVAGELRHVDITVQSQLLDRIDRAAEQQGLSRSGFLAEGARRLLEAG